ncbi:MAG: hypothetical protein DMG32_01295 [Acidobacteria bacterium]|nr:MAG: hypothetical protein DMG32_01295 [Acidobacteriota bacterium]
MGTFTGGAGPAANAAPSAQTGSLSYLGDEPAARLGDGARPLPEEKAVDQGRPKGTGRSAPRSLGESATERAAAVARSARSVDRELGCGGDPGCRKPSARGLFDAAGRRGAGDGTGVCADHRASDRFASSKKVVSYLGLNPSEESSGGRQRLGAISKQGNPMMRYLLVEAAQTAARLDPELRRDYQRLKFRRGSAVAKVAIARKLAVRLYWKLREAAQPVSSARMQGSPASPVVGESLSSY